MLKKYIHTLPDCRIFLNRELDKKSFKSELIRHQINKSMKKCSHKLINEMIRKLWLITTMRIHNKINKLLDTCIIMNLDLHLLKFLNF